MLQNIPILHNTVGRYLINYYKICLNEKQNILFI